MSPDTVHSTGTHRVLTPTPPAEWPGHFAIGPSTPALHAPVSEAMTREIVCATPDMTIDYLTTLFLERNISGAPVVDDSDRPIGVVSKTDILRRQHVEGDAPSRPAPTRVRTWQGYEYELDPKSRTTPGLRTTVGEIMLPMVFSLPATAPISRAAALMAFEGIHRLPIVAEDGSLVGLLSSLDVLRWLARHDGYLAPPARSEAR
ncbi:MAG: CBS domain-containing protein [Myxococcota bacterium]